MRQYKRFYCVFCARRTMVPFLHFIGHMLEMLREETRKEESET
jgi:hypothetical protein